MNLLLRNPRQATTAGPCEITPTRVLGEPLFFYWRANLFSSGRSTTLLLHIVLTEFWHPDVSLEELLAEEQELLAVEGSSRFDYLSDVWPRYPLDEYHGAWPEPSVPVLVLQGGVDPLTPYGALTQSHYSGPEQYYVELPHAGHAVMVPTSSPMREMDEPGCGFEVVRSFLADPSRPPDTSCVANTARIQFDDLPRLWLDVLGIEDVWENP